MLEWKTSAITAPWALFKALAEAFGETIHTQRRTADLVKELPVQAAQTASTAMLRDPDRGHAGARLPSGMRRLFAILRVAATAPEILLITQYIVTNPAPLSPDELGFGGERARDAVVTSGLDDDQHIAFAQALPLSSRTAFASSIARVRSRAAATPRSIRAGCAEAVVGAGQRSARLHAAFPGPLRRAERAVGVAARRGPRLGAL